MSSTNQSQSNEMDEFDRWDPMKEDFESTLNTLALNPNKDPTCVITGNTLRDFTIAGTAKICERYAKYNECSDKKHCRYLHIDQNRRQPILQLLSTYESNKGRIILTSTNLSPVEIKVDPRKLLLGSVTNAITPTNFFIIFPYENMDFEHYSQDDMDFYMKGVQISSTAKSKLEKFHKHMAAIYDHGYREDNLRDDLYPSQIVACKQTDGRFRRAMVVDVPVPHDDKFNYTLLLIDFGIEIELPRELIYDIKAECLSDGPLAVRCRLDVKPIGGRLDWSEEALIHFENISRKDKYLCCRLFDYIETDDIFTVDLVTTSNRESLTSNLIAAGYAERVQW